MYKKTYDSCLSSHKQNYFDVRLVSVMQKIGSKNVATNDHRFREAAHVNKAT